jgi:hypothetical protein
MASLRKGSAEKRCLFTLEVAVCGRQKLAIKLGVDLKTTTGLAFLIYIIMFIHNVERNAIVNLFGSHNIWVWIFSVLLVVWGLKHFNKIWKK